MRYVFAIASLLLAVTASAADINWKWDAPTKWEDGTAIQSGTPLAYRVYAALQGQPKKLLTTTAVTGLTWKQAGVAPGVWCAELTAIGNGAEGQHSLEGCATVTAPPAPKPAAPGAPTGEVVLIADNSAYKMRQAVDGYSFVSIGRIPVGTSCSVDHSADGYSLVPRSNVTLTSRFDTMPLVVFAKCG